MPHAPLGGYRFWWAPWALLLLISLLGLGTHPAWASGCFQPIYYQAMFDPVPQEARGGDPRLQGASDTVAAMGRDPHGAGCMCGINQGRWDQVLFNSSLSDQTRVPVSFVLEKVHVQFWLDPKTPKGRPVDIAASEIESCWNLGLAKQDWRPFNHPSGRNSSSRVLEPGENLLSCLCLGPQNRQGTGQAWVTVKYRPAVMARELAAEAKGQGRVWRAVVELKDLAPGGGGLLTLTPPDGASQVSLSLVDAPGAKLKSRLGWHDDPSGWQKSPRDLANLDAGQSLWIWLTGLPKEASGRLEVSWQAKAGSREKEGWRLHMVGAAAERSFKTHIMCGYNDQDNSPAGAKALPFDWQRCCNSPSR